MATARRSKGKHRIGHIPPVPRRSRGRPRAGDVAELDRALIHVATQFFAAKGYGATSIAEIARAARASKGTLYARFASKAELFKAIIDEQIQRTAEGNRRAGPRPRTLQAMLHLYAERALADSLSSETLSINRLIYSEAERFPELADAALARGQVGLRQVSRYIEQYASNEKIPCRRPEAAADIFLKLIRGWYGEMMLRGRPVAQTEIRKWVRRMLDWFMATRSAW